MPQSRHTPRAVPSALLKRVLLPALATVLILGSLLAVSGTASAGTPSTALHHGHGALPRALAAPGDPDLGPHTYVFSPSMSVADIQAVFDAVAAQQVGNQFGTARYALLFKPGTYGSAADPLDVQVGYYTEVAGLGKDPGDVTVNGTINVFNQCDAPDNCTALNNFWRSLSNLTLNVVAPAGCRASEFWAVSQAAPMRRVSIDGPTTLMDYCTAGPQYASGGFIADSRFSASVINGSQQQFLVRNSTLGGWSNAVWNQVFSGVLGAPAESFATGTYYTNVAATPVTRERPYLYVTSTGAWRVFIPAPAVHATGPSWSDTASTQGTSVALSHFYLAKPGDSAATLTAALAHHRGLLLTPGVYQAKRSIEVDRDDAIVLGLGLPSITARRGVVPLEIGNVRGADIAGLTVDAGPTNSPALLRVGPSGARRPNPADPIVLQDVFFRVGGPHAGKATKSLVVNSDHVVLDDIWAWRADHGNGVGWTDNTAANGVVVNGDHVSATGLFVEHYQKVQVLWNGEHGSDIFFQSEMPYDVPTQAAWRQSSTTNGYPSFRVGSGVQTFRGVGMGSYSNFIQGTDIVSDRGFQAPTRPGVRLHDLLTVFLRGSGGIQHVVNDTGAPVSSAAIGVPSTVLDYP